MTDNNLELNTTDYKDDYKDSGEHRSHHHHSSHRHSHHSHSSSGHSHHRHSHSSGSRSSSSRKKNSTRKSSTDKKFSLAKFLEKTSLSLSSESIPKYRKISQRVLFCLIFFGCVAIMIVGIIAPPKDNASINAGQTRSETDLLKSQIIVLQTQKEQLEKELAKYKELYGELEPEPEETQIPQK